MHDAYQASGDDPDAPQLRDAAKGAYVQAGERADSVGAPETAEAAYLLAAELSTDEAEQTALTERAGFMAFAAGLPERALPRFEAAVRAHRTAGRVVEAARTTAELGTTLNLIGRGEEAIVILREALELEGTSLPADVVAILKARLAGALLFSGHSEAALEPLDGALIIAQQHELSEILGRALNLRGTLLATMGRFEEARLHYEGSAEVCRRIGMSRGEMISEANLADLCMVHDREGVEEHCQTALAIARLSGNRSGEATVVSNLCYFLMMRGRLEEVRRLCDEVIESGVNDASWRAMPYLRLVSLDTFRGDAQIAEEHLGHCGDFAESNDVQNRAMYAAGESAVALSAGRYRQAFDAARRAIEACWVLSPSHESVRLSVPLAIDAALALGDLDALDGLVEQFVSRPTGEIPPFLRAEIGRAAALLAAARSQDEGVEDGLTAAVEALRELGYPYWAAQTEIDLADWLAGQGRGPEAETMARRAAATLEPLEARPLLARAEALLASCAGERVASVNKGAAG